MENTLYTAGDLANLTHISSRTIRFYDQKGLLKPVSYSDTGYRLYNQHSLLILQRILVFKHLGFSLQEIENMLEKNQPLQQQLIAKKEQFERQRHNLQQKIQLLELAIEDSHQTKWNTLVNLCHEISTTEIVQQQYATTTPLQQRINIHSYSTNEFSWFDFVVSYISIKEHDQILEIGCGTGALWKHLIPALPNHLNITLTDYSEEMLKKCEEVFDTYKDILIEKDISIRFEKMDANIMELNENQFDVIIANHMLYHVSNRQHCLSAISKALKSNGTFYCTTIGDSHMKEFFDTLTTFDSSIENPNHSMTSGFLLENAYEQLITHFKNVERFDHDNDLLVDDCLPIIEYTKSLPGNVSYIVNKKIVDFTHYLNELIDKEGAIFISKSTGIFVCNK